MYFQDETSLCIVWLALFPPPISVAVVSSLAARLTSLWLHVPCLSYPRNRRSSKAMRAWTCHFLAPVVPDVAHSSIDTPWQSMTIVSWPQTIRRWSYLQDASPFEGRDLKLPLEMSHNRWKVFTKECIVLAMQEYLLWVRCISNYLQLGIGHVPVLISRSFNEYLVDLTPGCVADHCLLDLLLPVVNGIMKWWGGGPYIEKA